MATRWGISSAGRICEDFVSALSTLPSSDHQVVAVAARQLDRAQTFAEKFKIPKAYGSYEELAKDDNIDVIYVGSIHLQHHQHVLLFLNNGKNVLCEKPVAMNSKQLKEMTALAKEKKLFFMEAMVARFFPVYGKVQEELANGSLGKVHHLRMELARPAWHVPFLHKNELGGGGLLGFGIYTVSVALFLFGKPDKVVVEGFLQDEVDQSACIIFKYKDGRTAQFTYSLMFEGENECVIYGTEGQIKIPGPFWASTEVILPTGRQEFPLPATDAHFNYQNSCGMCYEAEHVRQCLLEGKTESPKVPLAHNTDVMAIMDQIRRDMGVRYAADD